MITNANGGERRGGLAKAVGGPSGRAPRAVGTRPAAGEDRGYPTGRKIMQLLVACA